MQHTVAQVIHIDSQVMEPASVDEPDDGEQAEYSRMRCDPGIGISNLEQALTNFFQSVGYRNMQEVLDIIMEAKCTWKTAPKAMWLVHACL